MEMIKIPEKRVASLLGKDGKTIKEIEKKCMVRLKVSGDGEVGIEGETADIFFAKDVIKAIGRGFEPRDAMRLIDENWQFLLIDLKDYLSTDKALKRIKGRIIGEDGKMKSEIENATESKISVYGSTVGIISKMDTIGYAETAVMKLISGAQHSSVINYLGKVKKELLAERLRGK